MLRKLGKNHKVIQCYESFQLNQIRKVYVRTQVKQQQICTEKRRKLPLLQKFV